MSARWAAASVVVLAAAILVFGVFVAAPSALSMDVGTCYEEAPEGTVGLLAVAVGVPVVLVLEALTFLLVGIGLRRSVQS